MEEAKNISWLTTVHQGPIWHFTVLDSFQAHWGPQLRKQRHLSEVQWPSIIGGMWQPDPQAPALPPYQHTAVFVSPNEFGERQMQIIPFLMAERQNVLGSTKLGKSCQIVSNYHYCLNWTQCNLLSTFCVLGLVLGASHWFTWAASSSQRCEVGIICILQMGNWAAEMLRNFAWPVVGIAIQVWVISMPLLFPAEVSFLAHL